MQEENMRKSSIICAPKMEGGFRLVKNPVWLPKEWTTLAKTRKTGHTAGLTDKYFVEPVSNRKFRSRKEVFKFLEIIQINNLKRKRDDSGCKASGGGGNSSRGGTDNASQATSGINVNSRPTKLRWVYNSSEGSWLADEITEANSGEVKVEIHGGQEQLQTEDDSASTRLTFETVIDLNKPKEGLPIVSPFGDSWPDPCLEFAVKTLTGAIPVLDDNFELQNALLRYFSPQAKTGDKLWSNSGSFNSLGSVKAKGPSDGSKGSQNYISATDGLPKNVNKLIRHQAKNWLEDLGRKLCKKALDLMKNANSAAVINKQEKKLRTSFRLSRKAQNIQIGRGNPQHHTLVQID